MAITENELIANVRGGKFAPVYLLTGEENYYIDRLSDFFEKEIVAEEYRDFDQTVLYGGETHMSEVVGCAKRFPMMSPVQLVLVKEAQGIDIREWDLLASYLESPMPQTILVLCYRHKKLDKRTKAYKAIDEKGVVFERAKLYDNQVPGWIADQVTKSGYSITERGAMLITAALGNDLGKIANELSKVYISLPKGSVISEEVIEKEIGISKDYNIFELQTAIARRDVVQCNRIVNHIADNPKDNPIQMMLPVLYGFFIKVMLYHQLTDKREAARALKVPPIAVRDYEAAARNYSLGKLASCIGYIYDTDLRSKGVRNNGTVTSGELLKELIFRVTH